MSIINLSGKPYADRTGTPGQLYQTPPCGHYSWATNAQFAQWGQDELISASFTAGATIEVLTFTQDALTFVQAFSTIKTSPVYFNATELPSATNIEATLAVGILPDLVYNASGSPLQPGAIIEGHLIDVTDVYVAGFGVLVQTGDRGYVDGDDATVQLNLVLSLSLIHI